MKYAVIVVPDLSLHALLLNEPDLAYRPVALIEGEGRRAVVVQFTKQAEGIEPGLAVTLAMARCSGLLLRQRNHEAETVAHRLLAAAAFSFSPRVEVTGVDHYTVDLQGADPAETESSAARCVLDLKRAGLPAKVGVGETPLLALYAARCAESVLVIRDTREFLCELPISMAEPSPEQAEVLQGWGIGTLGQLTAIAKTGIAQRLGTAGVALWERAAGEVSRSLRLTLPSQSFAAAWDYEPPIENIEPLFFKLRRYADCLSLELRSAGYVAESLSLTLDLEDETDYHRDYRLAEPNTDVESWIKVLHSQLETLSLPARVSSVRLVAKQTRPQVKQDGLFDTGLRDQQAFWENIARVEAILGSGRIGTPAIANTWRPDSCTMEKPLESVPPSDVPAVHPERGGILRRFRPAKEVMVVLENARPVGVSGFVNGHFRAVTGPWRLSGDWWKPECWAFEIWQVEMESGGIYQLARKAEGWWLEGVVD